ncbi:hypothetical protein KKB71_02710, partial [Patescibacteria group bacterium]|nr:hypothetical protein [Patescibacteria group bacterium]
FVFLAATVLFAIRTIALLFLMILAPLAFLAMVLPKTQQYASEWWDKLFKWSFFAPAFMFMIYIVAKIIASDDFQKIIKGVGADPSASIGGAVTGADPGALGVMVNYILLIGLMIGSLIVAQRMGAVGSGAVMSWGKKLKSAGQGYAGKISKRGAGYAAEKALDEKSWINKKTGGRISKAAGLPIVGRGFAKVSSWGQQEKVKKQKEYEKQYGSHSTAGLQAVLKDPTVSDARKAAAKGVMAKRQSGEKEKQELERLERHLPTMETLVPGLTQKIKSIDSDIEDIITDVTAAEYKLAEAVKSGDTMAINLAKGELNVAKKRKAQKLIEKQRATESLSKIEKYGERKEKLEERKERKGETAGLQASISGIKTGGGGKPTP